jgi:hypothetical protein
MKSKSPLVFEITDVKTYSGGKEDEYPLSFRYKNTLYDLEEVLDQWYESGLTPGKTTYHYFKIQTKSGQQFLLRRNINRDIWSARELMI